MTNKIVNVKAETTDKMKDIIQKLFFSNVSGTGRCLIITSQQCLLDGTLRIKSYTFQQRFRDGKTLKMIKW